MNLINQMLQIGANLTNIVAHVYGGASSFPDSDILAPGKKNAQIAIQVLNEWKIPIIEKDTGGCFGRKIHFDTRNGEILVEKLDSCLRQCNRGQTCDHSI